MSLIEVFRSGGPVMWPLIICSLIALGLVWLSIAVCCYREARR